VKALSLAKPMMALLSDVLPMTGKLYSFYEQNLWRNFPAKKNLHFGVSEWTDSSVATCILAFGGRACGGDMEYEFHPAADLFPMMSDEELVLLGDDMLEHGQREPIILYHGQILDGRNRYRACVLKGIEPKFRSELPADPYAFVASANLHRRHLDASQRAMIADKLAMLREGRPSETASRDAITQSKAASLLEVSRPSVQRARYVREHGVPDLVDAVKRGNVKIRPAAEFASAVPPLDQQRLIAEHGSPAAAVKATVKAKAQSQIVIAQVQNRAPSSSRTMSAADAGPVAHDHPDLRQFAKFCRERDPVIVTHSVREFERTTFRNDVDDIARWINAVRKLLKAA
jgi:ParB-like chromosome segregation protein Spo0J